MSRVLQLLIFLLLTINAKGQEKYDYVWLFGARSSPNDTMQGGTNIDFNLNPVSLDYEWRDITIGSYNSSICNENGELQFYTNGCFIVDASHEIMMNGDSLNPGVAFDEFCSDTLYPFYPTTQNSFILPQPGTDSLYYLFHKGEEILDVPLFIYMNRLYYSLVDMSLNNGLGLVVEKNVLLLEDSLSSGQFTAVKHMNGEDWWIMCPKYRSKEYCTFLLTGDSIKGPFSQEIGMSTTNGGGQAVFSPHGNTYVRYNPTDGAFVFQFDRESGLLDDFTHLAPEVEGLFGGAAISPNNRFLYITSWNEVRQYDLEATDIDASEVIVATYDGFVAPFPTNFYQAQLGPDCRIYINSTNGNYVLHVINRPDESGLACELVQHGIHLPTRHAISLPNFPNYRLGTSSPTCNPDLEINIVIDTTVMNNTITKTSEYDLSVYPNPVDLDLQISCDLPAGGSAIWVLSNANGEEQGRLEINDFQEIYTYSTRDLPVGIYFYHLRSDLGVLTRGKVVVAR